ncbi:hypothetical protein ACWC2T_21825 [Streptomyces sp. NPDC001393]
MTGRRSVVLERPTGDLCSRRDRDGTELRVVHVEDGRPAEA